MTLSVTLREARVEDASILLAAEQEITRTPGQLASHPSELRLEAFEEKIRKLQNNPRGKYLVALNENQKIVGHAFLDPLHLLAIQHVAHLSMAVHPGSQRMGVGEALLKKLIEWAKSAPGVEKIELQVRSGNERAIALYRKLGFAEEGRWKRRVKISGDLYFDDILMGLFV